jgi:hypothetical protein
MWPPPFVARAAAWKGWAGGGSDRNIIQLNMAESLLHIRVGDLVLIPGHKGGLMRRLGIEQRSTGR